MATHTNQFSTDPYFLFSYSETDRRNALATGWTGGSGVLPQNPDLLEPCKIAAWMTLITSINYVTRVNGPLAGSIGVFTSFLMMQYSAPPFRLNAGMGLGEPVVGLWLSGLIPLFGYAVATTNSACPLAFGKIFMSLLPGMVIAFSRQL